MNPDSRNLKLRSWIVGAALFTGVAVGAAGIAGAVTGSSSTSAATPTTVASSAPAQAAPRGAPAQDPATMSHGPGETLLTGDTAAKVKAAALAAQPGATIIRVETDSGGATYEAHLKKADGTEITLKFDANFKVTATQDGFGGGGPGH